MPYGVSNCTGQVSLHEARRILAAARAAGIDTVDTAALYQSSEATLGAAGVQGFRVITKLPGLPSDCTDVGGWVRRTLATSLKRLGLDQVGGLLLHRPADLLGPRGAELAEAVRDVKAEGLAQAVGYSVYGPHEIDALLSVFRPDLVQAPYNILDRRIEASGALARLTGEGVEIHIRSVFLQGLLIMPRGTWPRTFRSWTELLERWHDWCAANEIEPVRACLAHAAALAGANRIVVGVETVQQLGGLVLAIQSEARRAPLELACDDERLINPSNWTVQ
jgi:aryl-alcohol dehydrogenase-like predicted oxidoreductase